MANWMKRLLRHKTTIGDHIADSLTNEPEAWDETRRSVFTWEYENRSKGWTILLFNDCFHASVSFMDCGLTSRERRVIMRVLNRRAKATAKRRRDLVHRRLNIRAVN
jgi:hypothetical protein